MSFGATALIWHHSQAKGVDLLVAMSLANFISDEGAWPKVETIAAGARTSVRQAHRSLKKLAELGEITWEKGAGGGQGVYKTSRYFVLLTCPENCSGDWNHSTKKDARPDTQSPLVCQPVTPRPDTQSPLDLTHTADKPVIEQVTERVKRTYTKQTKNNKELFDSFWELYPRKQSKPVALKAFEKALKVTTAEVLINAAHAYAHDPNRDPAFTKLPATWLNQECWDDDPLPSRTADTKATRSQQAKTNFLQLTEHVEEIPDWMQIE